MTQATLEQQICESIPNLNIHRVETEAEIPEGATRLTPWDFKQAEIKRCQKGIADLSQILQYLANTSIDSLISDIEESAISVEAHGQELNSTLWENMVIGHSIDGLPIMVEAIQLLNEAQAKVVAFSILAKQGCDDLEAKGINWENYTTDLSALETQCRKRYFEENYNGEYDGNGIFYTLPGVPYSPTGDSGPVEPDGSGDDAPVADGPVLQDTN